MTTMSGWYGALDFTGVCAQIEQSCQYEIDMERAHRLEPSATWPNYLARVSKAREVYGAVQIEMWNEMRALEERYSEIAQQRLRAAGYADFADALRDSAYDKLVF